MPRAHAVAVLYVFRLLRKVLHAFSHDFFTLGTSYRLTCRRSGLPTPLAPYRPDHLLELDLFLELDFLPALAQVWQLPLGVRGTPCPPGGHAGRAHSRRGPAAKFWGTRARRERLERTALRAHTARTRHAHVEPKHIWQVQPARLPVRRMACLPACRKARSRQAERRAPGAQYGALPACRTACSRHAERRAPGALSDASHGAQNGALPAP